MSTNKESGCAREVTGGVPARVTPSQRSATRQQLTQNKILKFTDQA